MKTHWWHFLPEAGRFYLVDSQETRLRRIAEAERQIEILQAEYDKEDEDIEAEALDQDWTIKDIMQAKADAEEFISVREKQNFLRYGIKFG